MTSSSCLENDFLDDIMGYSSVLKSSAKLYQLASLPGSPSVYGRIRSWILQDQQGSDPQLYEGHPIIRKSTLKTPEDLDEAVQQFTLAVQRAARNSSQPPTPKFSTQSINLHNVYVS
ncbi:hypothetical protein AAG570_007742 [Ranatra chinensis]|uniref:Uncharacterized protein n=1 Tax=Ranatra chinensis TaxID=642074 RepID=A0ABD0Y7M6_9HEMI